MGLGQGGVENVGVAAEFWCGRRVLLTGHTGFKGAWLALWLEKLGAEVHGIALPPEGKRDAFVSFQPWPFSSLTERMIDIRDASPLTAAVREIRPSVVLHLAAQALVRRSYQDPAGTFATNVQGTIHLLDAVRACGGVEAVVAVTSDKVYANDDSGRPFVESDALGGSDPYSASKAACEIAVASWRKSFLAASGVAVATARAGNVIGGGDWAADRLLPDLYRALEADEPLRLRRPDATRPWQHVLEPLAGYLMLAQALATRDPLAPTAVNFGPGADGAWTVRRVIETSLAQLGQGRWEQDGDPGPAEAAFLSLDPSLAERALGWRPRLTVADALAWTGDWWRCECDGGDLRALAGRQIDAYTERLS